MHMTGMREYAICPAPPVMSTVTSLLLCILCAFSVLNLLCDERTRAYGMTPLHNASAGASDVLQGY